MIYEVENQPKKLSLEQLDQAIEFASKFLDLDIDLLIEFERLKKHQCGFCEYDEDEVTITISKRLGVQEIIATLFHEMIHVKQYADGRLQYDGVWLGKKYECAYDQLPWEIEAHEMERIMMEKFGEI